MTMAGLFRATSALCALALIGACASTSDEKPSTPLASTESTAAPSTSTLDVDAIVNAPDRSETDKALDAGRKPAALLAFSGIAPGMRVADLMAGGGYSTELLARAVGDDGTVYAQNNRFVLERFAEAPFSARLATPAMHKVVRVDRELEEPLPDDARDLDAVFMVLFYHDAVWMNVDRARMNRAIHDALKPGGVFVVVDHSAIDGHGLDDVQTLHRIEEKVVTAEITAAGFTLVETAPFLRNPGDARDWNDAPSAAADRRGTSDRFVLKFRRD